jgi:polyisoprenyl-phosphate glycosyltransferase
MKINQPISVIVKAFNEGENISRVLKPLIPLDFIDEIIVVDDGSTDNTAEVVKSFNSKKIMLVSHSENQGMGAAMATGIKSAKYDLLFFLDADLIGLKEEHILAILAPIVFTKKADLVLGVFALKKLSKDPTTKIANRLLPLIAGQRAIWRNCLPPLDEIRDSHYGADLLIARNVVKKRRAVVKLDELSQVTKEKKAGHDFAAAVKARIKMYKEVIQVLIDENKH